MKILHIHPSMKAGGIEAMICALANEMALQGHDVSVCSIYEQTCNDVFWNKLSPNIKKISLNKIDGESPVKTIYKVWRLLKNNNFDIVQMHGYFYYYFVSIFTIYKHKYFYTIHNDASQENVVYDKYLIWLKRFSFKHNIVHPVTISRESQKSFEQLYHSDNRLIYNGILVPKAEKTCDLVARFRYTDYTKVFLNPARISEQKNQILLVKTFHRLICEGYDVVLLIAGTNQDQIIFNEITEYLNDRIRYIGEQSDIPTILQNSDAMCLSSSWEGLPVTLLESLSLGIIPICTPVGGIPDIIHDGKNGFLSECVDVDSYYSALKRFISTKDDDLIKIKENCINSFAPYHITKTVNQYIDYYKKT